MARGKGKNGGNGHSKKRPIERYEHTDKKRVNNPPVGLVTPETDPPLPTHKIYDYIQPVPDLKPGKELSYDPHLDPQLVWAGKKEHASFEVPTVSLHVHETIDPRTIIEAVRKRNGNGLPAQPSLFERPEEKLPLRQAIDFYKHAHGWSNRLIAGDSLLVMNSLLEKEGMAGQVQMVYIDPPYGIKYGSNFQPFVNKRDVKDGKDEDLTQEPEMIRAFRDTWELGIHSYLTYLRDRLLLARELLHESGSCFLQISDENVQLVRCVLDDVFEPHNFISLISFQKKGSQTGDFIPPINEYIVWFAKDAELALRKFHRLYQERHLNGLGGSGFDYLELQDGQTRRITAEESGGSRPLPAGARPFSLNPLFSQKSGPNDLVEINGKKFPSGGNSWKVSPELIPGLFQKGRAVITGTRLRYKRYADDFNWVPLSNVWLGLAGASDKIFVVQTNTEVLKRCVLMTTDCGDLVLDPTCGSGTTAFVAEEWGRRWITCDTSRVATALTKQRLMTASYDYYELAHPQEGVGSGLTYETVQHAMLETVAKSEPPKLETLWDRPHVDKSRVRVTGPFTVEAVPAPTVRSLEDIELEGMPAKIQESLADFRDTETPLLDASVARKGATLRHTEWRDELLKTGLRGKGGHHIDFSRVEPLAGTRWLHADAETKGTKPERVVVSFGPEYSLLEQRQVELAWEEARTLVPKPSIIVFAAFEFDPEAAKDIDAMTKEKAGMTFLTAQMNADLLTEDLKKKRASNQSFWLVGRPDIELQEITKGEHKGKWQAGVRGFDYYNTRTGTIESGDTSKIAMWLLDTDYDGRSLYPRQVFFPMADDDEGWARLARNLKAEIDSELIQQYRGTTSLPFELGPHKRVAVKVIDDRGIESLKVVDVK
ncbi:MAG: site-specific DNA-methyltransferase [Candidatus Dormibacteria bacterium]